MTKVNGHEAEHGCYIDGHWGQYGPDRLAEVAEGFGWSTSLSPVDDPRVIRKVADDVEAMGYADAALAIWEWRTDAADAIEEWLNDRTPPTCIDCGRAMYPTSDGFYRHDGLTNGTAVDLCGHAATLDADHHVWHWRDGELFLSPLCDDDDDCDDDTCAHWD